MIRTVLCPFHCIEQFTSLNGYFTITLWILARFITDQVINIDQAQGFDDLRGLKLMTVFIQKRF